MTQLHEQSDLTGNRSQRSRAWKPIQCRSTASRFDEMEADLLRSAGANGGRVIPQLPMPGDAGNGEAVVQTAGL